MKEARPTTIPGGEEAVVDEEEDETPGLLAEVGNTKARRHEGTGNCQELHQWRRMPKRERERERGKERG